MIPACFLQEDRRIDDRTSVFMVDVELKMVVIDQQRERKIRESPWSHHRNLGNLV
jgi:hypothetical protein